MSLKLYSYFRSSAAYRVRIALNIKGLDYTQVPVNLVSGEQRSAAYLQVNPAGLVPTLICEDGTALSESMAICEYLEEEYPQPALLPAERQGRARVRELANLVACDIHPLNNLRVLKYLTAELGIDPQQKNNWYKHWIASGFSAFEKQLSNGKFTGKYCYGDRPTLADVLLIPQVYNAKRFDCDLMAYPTIRSIAENCDQLPAFQAAHPSRQPDGNS